MKAAVVTLAEEDPIDGMSPRLKKSDLTRSRLLDAAAFILQKKGYALTRLSDIAKREKMQTSSIYYYFKSREAVVSEVLRIANERTAERVNSYLSALPPDATAKDRLTAAIRGHYDIVLSRDPFILAHMKIFDQVPAKISKQFRSVLQETNSVWKKILTEGQKAGHFRMDIDVTVAQHLLLGMMNWSIEWFRPGRYSADEIAQQTATLFFNGIETLSGQNDGS